MPESLRILILEDNPIDAELIQFELEESGLAFRSRVVKTEKEFIRAIEADCPDLILSDYDLPAYNGALALAEANRRCPDVPFILVTGAVSEERAIEILTQGAQDYVLKRLLEQRLVPAIRRALKESEERRARKKAEEELREAHRTLEEKVEERTAELQAEIAVRKKTEEALLESEERLNNLYQMSPIPTFTWQKRGDDFILADFNRAAIMLTNHNAFRFLGRRASDLYRGRPQVIDDMNVCFNGQSVVIREMVSMDFAEGRFLKVHYGFIPPDSILVQAEDVTERKEAERRQTLVAEILGIISDSHPFADTIDRILTAIKKETRFDAVGIRLRSGDDYPYFVQYGFSSDFLLAENSLTVRADDGGLCKDENGNVSLECTCGLVISGQADPAIPLLTQGGSFWTNDTLPLLDLTADQEPRLNPRNRCIHEGFRSVALIPIRASRQIVGLLQLNDRDKDCFTPDMIRFFEGLGSSIGIALSHREVAQAV
ncbi:MAG: response regulator [Deltaproteobacteria bacterium]|nr:response regulator [Deltaproteobacteria bacterium]